jgi:hypothetical protein
MKQIIILLVLCLPVFFACKKSGQDKPAMNVTSADWYTTTSKSGAITFCNVHLKVAGTTNAALLSIATYGDGVNGCTELTYDAEHRFSADVVICFFMVKDSAQRKFSTQLTGYSSRVKPAVVLCNAVGSGETISYPLESPLLKCY